MPWMPKGRYAIMRRYMPLVGTLGLDMMTRTCTVQVNLDYASEQDMLRKLRVSLLLQPLATALFANSPFTEGQPNGYLSYRAQVWTDTDNQRSGIPRVMFEPGFGFERYVEWLVDRCADVFRLSRRAIYRCRRRLVPRLHGRAAAQSGGDVATVGDFADHVTTVFTDVRIKRFLEMRGADAGRADMMVAQSAFWVGLLYDDAALAAAEALVRDADLGRRGRPAGCGAARGSGRAWRGGTLRDLARDVIAIAATACARGRGLTRPGGMKPIHLDPLAAIAAGEPTQAEHWLARFHQAWQGDVRRIFSEGAI